jgi:SAM-dependent methyltransferase
MEIDKIKEITDIMFSIPQENHPERLFVIKEIGNIEDKTILDIGCGRHKTVSQAIGIDILEGSDIVSSGDELKGIKDKSVDVIISRHSLEHILDTVKTLREWARVLKSKGKIIIILPDHEFIDTMDTRLSMNKHLHAFTRQSFNNLINLINELSVKTIGTCVKEWSFYAVLEKKSKKSL